MTRTGYKLQRRGEKIVAALVSHCDGRQHVLVPDSHGFWLPGSGDLHSALQLAAVELEATYGGMPAPIVDPGAWITLIAADKRVKRTALRAATIIAMAAPGQWLPLASIGHRLGVDFRNVAKATGQLCRLGYLRKTHEGSRVLYGRTLP